MMMLIENEQLTNSGQLQAQLLDWNPVAGGRFVRFLLRLIIITTLLIADQNRDENDESKCDPPTFFPFCAQEKLSAELNGASDCPCSRASPGNKSGIKRIFSIATKMASKAADGDKKT